MSLAEDLLKHISVQPDPEGHIVIGGDRFITVPENLKRLAVQYDHNMETVTFDSPLYWDGQDMSKMAIYVNYARSDMYADKYPVKNIRVDGDIMHFDWTISGNVTEVAGAIAFNVCVMKTDAEGNQQHHWNTEICRDCYVSKGMETEEHPALMYPDEVTQLLLRMSTVEQINVQAEEMNQLLADTQEAAAVAEAAKALATDEARYIRNSYAPAIKGTASGEVIRVDDVSPIEHDVKCFVHGKNQLSLVGTPSEQSTQSHTYRSWFVNPDRKTMALSVIEKDNSVDISDIYFGFCENGRDGLDGIKWLIEDGAVKHQDGVYSDLPYISIYPATQETVDKLNARFNIQLENGYVPTSYEPWIDPATVVVTCANKNLFSYPFEGTNYGNGIQFTDVGDGSIIVHGTNDGVSNSVFYITKDSYLTIPAGTYSCSPNVAGLVLMGVEKGGGYFTLASENKMSFTLSEPKTFRSIYVQIGKGNTTSFHNKKIRIMLEYGSILSKFESPASIIYTPSSNGTCIVTSKSPTMTLFTDTPGVTIEAEYNIDTTKFLNANVITDRIQAATTAWLDAHYAEAEGASF
jgi:hypothetical protein